MKKFWWITGGIIFFLIVFVILLVLVISGKINITKPEEITAGISEGKPTLLGNWKINKSNNQNDVNETINKKIEIQTFYTDQKIYNLKKTATAEFTIINSLGVPYNVSLYWYNIKIKKKIDKYDWNFNSTEYYDSDNKTNSFHDSNYANIQGDWKVQLLIEYGYQNESFKNESFTEFEVI